jgi:hypothetical protein
MLDKVELKVRLAKALRSRDIGNLWAYLKEERYAQEVLDGDLSFDDFVKAARRIKRAGAPMRSMAATASLAGPPPGQARSWALSMLVAAEAEREDAVTRFRRDVLNGTTIPRADVRSWVESHPETKLSMTRDITITVEDSDVEYDGAGWIRLTRGTDRYRLAEAAVKVLDYTGAEGDWVLRVGVRADGELDRAASSLGVPGPALSLAARSSHSLRADRCRAPHREDPHDDSDPFHRRLGGPCRP